MVRKGSSLVGRRKERATITSHSSHKEASEASESASGAAPPHPPDSLPVNNGSPAGCDVQLAAVLASDPEAATGPEEGDKTRQTPFFCFRC